MVGRFSRIDTVRFLAALMVFFYHGGGLENFGSASFYDIYVASLNGRAAVLVFFVISGFCIHAPFSQGQTLDAVAFYLRRFIRIGLPAMVLAFGLYAIDTFNGPAADGRFWHASYFSGLTSVAWSLIAEASYYAIYPLVLPAARRWGMGSLVAVSAVMTVVLTGILGSRPYIWEYSLPAMCVLGLPFWLTGALLAEAIPPQAGKARYVMIWRVAVFGYLFGAQYAVKILKITIPDPAAYLPFAAIVYKWLEGEVIVAARRSVTITEWAGTWSYSLYLTHDSLLTFWRQFVAPLVGAHVLLKVLLVLACAYLFSRCIEWPAQRLAGAVARAWSRSQKPIPISNA